MEISIIAGEVSGDIQAGRLVKELKKVLPDLRIWGIGGPEMESAGAELTNDITELAVVGFWEVIKNYNRIKEVFYNMLKEIKERRPKAVILIDYPGFNLRLAAKIKLLDIPIIYYISPQVWAWGKGRIKKIKKLVNKMIVIFPFEKDIYEREGVPAEFVGHPIIDVMEGRASKRDEVRKELGVSGSEKLIGILPGSRTQEVKRHLPVFLETARKLSNAKFVIGAASHNIYNLISDVSIPVLLNRTYDIMEASDLVLTSSGTATLETACFSTPMIVIYKLNWLTYLFIKQMIDIPNIAMVNVVGGKAIVPEFVQRRANSENIVREAQEILNNPDGIKNELLKVKEKLGAPGAVERAAKIICEAISD